MSCCWKFPFGLIPPLWKYSGTCLDQYCPLWPKQGSAKFGVRFFLFTQSPVRQTCFLLALTYWRRHILTQRETQAVLLFARRAQREEPKIRCLLWGHSGCWHRSRAPGICVEGKNARRVKWGWHTSLREKPRRGRRLPWCSLAPGTWGSVWRPPESSRLELCKHICDLWRHPDTNTLML